MTVIKLPIITKADHSPNDILDAAKGKLVRVTIVGETESGALWVSGSTSDMSSVVMDLEMAKALLVKEALAQSEDAKDW